jgi:hypothetical protein
MRRVGKAKRAHQLRVAFGLVYVAKSALALAHDSV